MIKHALYVATATVLAAASLLPEAHAFNNIIRPYQSVRSSGMGGVRLTTGLYDENFYGNPARTSYNPNWKVQIFDLMAETNSTLPGNISKLTAGGSDVMQNMASTAGSTNHARMQMSFPGVYLPNVRGGKMSFAFAVLTSFQTDLGLRQSYQVDPQTLMDVGPAFSVSRKFLENDVLAVGMTTHLAYRASTKQGFGLFDLLQGKSFSPAQAAGDGAHLDFDLGGTYVLPVQPKEFTLQTALVINNILGGKYTNLGVSAINSSTTTTASTTSSVTEQPRTLGIGISARKDAIWKLTDTVLAFEITDIGNNSNGSMFKTFHIGGETRFSVLILRAGLNQGYFTLGFGLDLKVLTLELTTYGEEMAHNVGALGDRRYAFRLALQI